MEDLKYFFSYAREAFGYFYLVKTRKAVSREASSKG
jgi:hypothetical protein